MGRIINGLVINISATDAEAAVARFREELDKLRGIVNQPVVNVVIGGDGARPVPVKRTKRK